MIIINLTDLIMAGVTLVVMLFCLVMYILIKIDKKKGGAK